MIDSRNRAIRRANTVKAAVLLLGFAVAGAACLVAWLPR